MKNLFKIILMATTVLTIVMLSLSTFLFGQDIPVVHETSGKDCVIAEAGGPNTSPRTGSPCTKEGCKGYASILCTYSPDGKGCTKVLCIQ